MKNIPSTLKSKNFKKIFLIIIPCFFLLLAILILPHINRKDTKPYLTAIQKAPGNIMEVENRKVHIIDKGKGPVIIMLHGFLYSTVMWENQITHFSKTHRVIAIDLFGMGYSERLDNKDYSLKTYSEEVIAIMNAIGVDSAVLMGQSFGGAISVYVAAHHPKRVESLVLSSPAILPYSSSFISKIYEAPFLGEFFNSLPGDGMTIQNIKSTWYYDSEKVSSEKMQNILEPLRIEGTLNGLLYLLRHVIVSPLVQKEAEILYKNPLPILLVHGKEDLAVPLSKSIEFIEKMKSHGHLIVFDKARHSPHEEYPEKFNELVDEFLSKQNLK